MTTHSGRKVYFVKIDADVAGDPEREQAALRAAGVHLAKDDDLVYIMRFAKTEEEAAGLVAAYDVSPPGEWTAADTP